MAVARRARRGLRRHRHVAALRDAASACRRPTSTSRVAPATPTNVLGVLSLFFWALTLVVVVKYLVFIMRADNKGEGGILALAALVRSKNDRSARRGSRSRSCSRCSAPACSTATA